MSKFDQFATIIKQGGIVLCPTDTIWGLGCDPTNLVAVERIIELTKRPASKSFILLVDNTRWVEKFIPNFPEVCYDLIDFSEEPLTIIYPGAIGLPKSVLAEDGSVGIRVTKDSYCITYLRAINNPLLLTSANLRDESPPVYFQDIHPDIVKGVDYILEGSIPEKNGKQSKIIKIGKNAEISIIHG